MGFPALKKISNHYRDNANVVSIAIQTVFEGRQVNTFDKLERTARRFHLTNIPFGHDPGSNGRMSNVLTRYRTRGTPWDIIIDPKGVIRYSTFTRSAAPIIDAIDKILKKNDLGHSLLYADAPRFQKAKWIGKHLWKPYTPGHLTLVKLWRETQAEADTIRDLAQWVQHKKGVSMILVRVPGPHEHIRTTGLKGRARKLGHKGGLVADLKGQILSALKHACHKPDLQALTLLVNGQGKIIWDSFAPVIRNKAASGENGQTFAALRKVVAEELPLKK